MNNAKANFLRNLNQQKACCFTAEYNTPENPESYCYAVPFKVFGRLTFIQELIKRGFFVRIDPKFEYACVRFNNTIDFNDFKQNLSVVSSV